MRFDQFIQKRANDFSFCVTLVDISLEDQPLIYVNESLCRLTGYNDQELVGKNCRVLQNGQGNPESRRVIREAINNRRPLCRDLLNFKKNGERFYNRIVLLPLRGPFYLGLQHQIPKEMFERFTLHSDSDILDKTKNPLMVLLLSERISEESYEEHFKEATQRLRNFILQNPNPDL